MPPDTLILVPKNAKEKRTTNPIIAGSVLNKAVKFRDWAGG
jgi:hypothetical protein